LCDLTENALRRKVSKRAGRRDKNFIIIIEKRQLRFLKEHSIKPTAQHRQHEFEQQRSSTEEGLPRQGFVRLNYTSFLPFAATSHMC
jgi:hypothetical protein